MSKVVGEIGEEFICALCIEPFTNTWTDNEAQAEYKDYWKERFPGKEDKELVTVCDSCYKRIRLIKDLGLI
jgi:hypothetical protein